LFDPCSAPVAPEYAAACAAAGVPADFIDTGGGKSIANGGNPNLSPEKADQLNVGIVLTPQWLGDLSVTAYYYKVKLEDAIVARGAQFILEQCYASGASLASPFCANISRDPNGAISQIRSIVQNIGRVETDGIDFGVNYRFPLGAGRVSLSWNSSYLLSYRQQDIPGEPATERAGSLRSSPQVGSYPEIKSQLRTTYSRDAWSIGHTLRMIGKAEVLGANPATNPYDEVSEVFYSDLFASTSIKSVQLTAGVNNVFDERAPLYFTTAGQRDFGLYDPIGRYFYFKASYAY
jgi:outer membrane receptor protein involved in Fe transport